MNQIYHPYHLWEDYKNGMYSLTFSDENLLIDNATKVLSSNSLFDSICEELIIAWPISTEVNLTNVSCNRRAWLGQAACCFKYSVPEILTRVAWNRLNADQQKTANLVAEKHIINYENKFKLHGKNQTSIECF